MNIAKIITGSCLLLLTAAPTPAKGQSVEHHIGEPPHNYHERTPQDRFSRLIKKFESGEIALDRSSEKMFLLSLLKVLDIPVTSQMLVFSTTSLQLSVISPSNPRALYFNEDVYLGYVPGGRLEIVSVDPELGGIFYLFDIPRETAPLRIERSQRCMNCHAGDDTGRVPGLVIKSVVPGATGGSLTSYRREQTGHTIPLEQRFGGWYVTGPEVFTNHWGNLTGRFVEGNLQKIPTLPGKRFSFDKYPVATSDVLPQLLHEHQAGFVNRVVEAAYCARGILHTNESLTDAQSALLDDRAQALTRYLLFADEAPLPALPDFGDPAYKTDFLGSRRASPEGISLKDLDLGMRLFKYRCSYMIYSQVFSELPSPLKQRIYQRLGAALNVESPDPQYAYLPSAEKKAIRSILLATIPELRSAPSFQ